MVLIKQANTELDYNSSLVENNFIGLKTIRQDKARLYMKPMLTKSKENDIF